MARSDQKTMCPSSQAKEGAQLLGVRQEDGTVAILPQPLPVGKTFIETANRTSPAEQKFRFTNKCVEGGCQQWNGKGCGIADRLVEHLDKLTVSVRLPPCGIRSSCRWHQQSGPDACRVCPYVITQLSKEEVEENQRAIQKFALTDLV